MGGDRLPTRGQHGGGNYGWDLMEGIHCYEADTRDRSGLVLPVVEYSHGDNNCSVTGGYVYRGTAEPSLQGAYFYGDYAPAASGVWPEMPAGSGKATSPGHRPANQLLRRDRRWGGAGGGPEWLGVSAGRRRVTVGYSGVPQRESWVSGTAYELYVGRWSRLVAREFLNWLNVPAKSHWLDVGCGTGILSQIILNSAAPSSVTGVDRLEGYVALAREQVAGRAGTFRSGRTRNRCRSKRECTMQWCRV